MKISITRALAEIKGLDSKISAAITTGVFVAITRGKDDQMKCANYAESPADVEAAILGSFSRVEDLITRRDLLKRLVVEANAQSHVVIGGNTMTVAAAIERKRSISFEQQFLAQLRQIYANASASVSNLQSRLDAEIDAALDTVYGKEKTKATAADFAAIATPKLQAHAPSLLDPKKIALYIQDLGERIQTFLTEVDFTLSEFNAKTEIDLPD